MFPCHIKIINTNISLDKHSSIYIYDEINVENRNMNSKITTFDGNDKYFLKNSKQSKFKNWNENYEVVLTV